MSQYSSSDGSHPHMLLDLMHNTDATNDSITKGELQASVDALRIRYRDPLLAEHDILPVRQPSRDNTIERVC